MNEKFKKRLIHFKTHGNIIEDFVCARTRRTRALRRAIHACFYAQCAAAVGCIIAAVAFDIGVAMAAVIAGALASCVVAFIALGGGAAEKTILYLLDIVYAIISFTAGIMGGGAAFFLCGALMVLAAAVSFAGYYVSYLREFLTGFSPAKLTNDDYTLIPLAGEIMEVAKEEPLTPPPPPKTELMLLSEQLAEILSKELPPKETPASSDKKSAPGSKTSRAETTDDAPPPMPDSRVSQNTDKEYKNAADTSSGHSEDNSSQQDKSNTPSINIESNVPQSNTAVNKAPANNTGTENAPPPFTESVTAINTERTPQSGSFPTTELLRDIAGMAQSTENAPPPFTESAPVINAESTPQSSGLPTTEPQHDIAGMAQSTENAPPPFSESITDIHTKRAYKSGSFPTTEPQHDITGTAQSTDNAPPPFSENVPIINTKSNSLRDGSSIAGIQPENSNTRTEYTPEITEENK